jgi:putative ABC transport system permease protein
MFRIALRTLRFRKGGFAATFIALFFGASMVMACGGLLETGVRTDAPAERLAGAQLMITGDQTYHLAKQNPTDEEEKSETAKLPERVRLDRGLIDTVRGVSGVAAAIGDVSFPVTGLHDRRPVSTDKQTLGHAWESARLTPYSIIAGGQPSGPGQVALDQNLAERYGVHAGGSLDVLVRGKTEHLTVSGIVAPAGIVSVPAMFFTDTDVARLASQPDRVDSIAVLTAPGTDPDQLKQQLDNLLRDKQVNILTGHKLGLAEFPEVAKSEEGLIVLAAVIGGFSIMVAMFVVASTLGLSIQHRYRELALLRAIGTTPRQLRRMVLGEALVVGVLAAALACAPGALFGNWLFNQLKGLNVVSSIVEFHQGFVPTIVGIGVGLLTTIIAGYVAAWRAGATRPTEALAEAATQRRWLSPTRIIGAALCFGGGIALAIVTVTVFTGPIAASTAGPSVMLWAIGLAFISPGITKLMTAVLRWPLQAFTGLAGYLALLNARARTVRLAAAVTPIMLATGIATANLYLQTTQVHAAKEAFAKDLRADVVLTSTAGGGLAPDLIGAVRAVPGVAGASEFVATTGYIEKPYDSVGAEDGWAIQGVSADGTAAIGAELTAGSLGDLRGNTIALPAEPAAKITRGVGDTITIRLGDRSTVDVRIVALFKGTPGFDKLLLPADLVTRHTTNGLPAQILVKAGPGVDSGKLAGTLTAAVADRPGVAVADRSAVTEAYANEQEIQASVNYLMVGMIMAYTAISVVNTLVMATARRRQEFGLQRLTGSTRGQVLRMMSVEALLVTAIGVVLGTIVSAGTLVPFSLVVSGTPLPSGPPWIYLGIIAAAGLMTALATILPTWFATRPRPAEAVSTPD